MASLLLAARSHPAFTDFYLQNEGRAPNQNGLESGKPDLQSVFKQSGGTTELGRWMAGVGGSSAGDGESPSSYAPRSGRSPRKPSFQPGKAWPASTAFDRDETDERRRSIEVSC